MSHIQQNSHSMNGINSLEINEIIFDDGTSITSNDFASSTDLTTLASLVQTNTNKVGISSSQATAITANSNKTGITTTQASAIAANSLKTGITTSQASAIANLENNKQDTLTVGDGIDITGTTIKAQYAVPNMILLAWDKDITLLLLSGQVWGDGGRNSSLKRNRKTGEDFSTLSSTGVVTLTKNGYYKIQGSGNTQSDGYNNRISFANYLRINNTDYFENDSYNFFGWTYTRNNYDGGHGSISFCDYIYLSIGDTIEIRHKVETGTDRNFNENLPESQVDNYVTLQIERIYETNPEY